MDDKTLLALCIWTEASGEPHEGKVAVGIVVWNRIKAHYASDGTMAGTVLRKDQFSAFYFDMIDGRYTRVCATPAAAADRAEALLLRAARDDVWGDCITAADEATTRAFGFVPGPQMQKLLAQPRAFLYLNPKIASPQPWATPEAEVATIYNHTFYRD